MDFFTGAFATAVTIGGYVVAGIFWFLGELDKKRKEREASDDKTATNLINNLQKTVEIQEKEIAKMQKDTADHTKARDEEIRRISDEMKHMQGRNAVLEDLFKGRDPAMQTFLKDAPSLITIARENNSLAKENSQALTGLTEALTDFIKTIKTHHGMEIAE